MYVMYVCKHKHIAPFPATLVHILMDFVLNLPLALHWARN